MTGESWIIYWNEYVSNTYLYGSEVLFHARDDIELKNQLMPPGTIIKRWYSKTSFQLMKVEPTLPMIDGEGKYRISVDLSSDIPEGYLIKLVFYDRYDVEVETQIVREKSAEFQCPLRTSSYEVQLINAGGKVLHFHSLVITEIFDDEAETIQ